LISFVLFAQKAAFNRTACQRTVRTRLSSCRKIPDFIARRVFFIVNDKLSV